MQDEHTATLLTYYTRHQTSVQWRGFLTALAEEFETQLKTLQLRILMARIGTRFAASVARARRKCLLAPPFDAPPSERT